MSYLKIQVIDERLKKTTKAIKTLILSQQFKESHKTKATDLTGDRKLGFTTTIDLMLKKSGKSLLNTLNGSKSYAFVVRE